MRMFKKQKSTTFYCFSPSIMLATLFVELGLATYAFIRYRADTVTKLAILLLICLAGFQWAEYNVCMGSSLMGVDWSKLGYVFITLLPPLGLHIVHEIAGKKSVVVPHASYALALLWTSYFLMSPTAFAGNECTGNYVIFQLNQTASYAYGLYYYGFLLLAMTLAYQWMKKAKQNRKLALRNFMIGYLAFIIPTAMVNTLKPSTTDGIPSIMCGFAVLFAVVLGLRVLPLVATQKETAVKTSK